MKFFNQHQINFNVIHQEIGLVAWRFCRWVKMEEDSGNGEENSGHWLKVENNNKSFFSQFMKMFWVMFVWGQLNALHVHIYPLAAH